MNSYQEISSVDEMKEALSASWECPVLILKHSTRCPISARAYKAYESFITEDLAGPVSCYLVKVIESRELSRWVADHLAVEHHSPQAILVKEGKPVWVSTHSSITQDSLQAACAEEAK